MKRYWNREYAAAGLATVIGIAGCVSPLSGEARAGESRQLRDALFEKPTLLHIQIEIPQQGLESLRQYRWQWNRQEAGPRPKVKVTVREGGQVFRNVSLHLKGAAGSFRPVDDRPAMTLNFDRHEKGQKFHGLNKFSLNNSVQDPTLCNERIARQLFLEAGVPTPRAIHARVELNGRDLGMYVLVEGYNKRFLRGYFDDDSGNLYDGGFVQDIDGDLGANSGETPEDRSDLAALAEAIQITDLDERESSVREVLDLDRFLSHLAMDVILFNWDGYHMNRNNYRIFHDRSRGKLVFMPHGLDQLFENPEGPLFPFCQGKVTQAVMEIPRVQEAFFERVGELVADLFQVSRIHDRIDGIAEVVRRDLVLNDPESVDEYLANVSRLKDRVKRRYETLERQLDGPSRVPRFDAAGLVSLDGWTADAYFGKPDLSQDDHEGRAALVLTTTQGVSIGRWQKKVWLKSGDYELTGQVKLQGIEAGSGDPRGGVALWSSTKGVRQRQTGDTDWSEQRIRFEVRQPIQEVQLYCEYRAAGGTAWFDTGSLKLQRLPRPQSD